MGKWFLGTALSPAVQVGLKAFPKPMTAQTHPNYQLIESFLPSQLRMFPITVHHCRTRRDEKEKLFVPWDKVEKRKTQKPPRLAHSLPFHLEINISKFTKDRNSSVFLTAL